MISFRQSITICISVVVAIADEPVDVNNISSPAVRAAGSAMRSLNTFIALDPATAPVYFADIPKDLWLPPAPWVSSHPTPKPSSQPTKPDSASPTLRPSRNVKDTTSSLQPLPPATAVYYPSISPLSTVLTTLPYNSQTQSPSTTKDATTIRPSPAPTKIDPPLVLTNPPNIAVTTPSLANFKWVTETSAQPASDGDNLSGYDEKVASTPAPAARVPNENINASHTPSTVIQRDEESGQDLSSHFETSIPKIQVNIEFSPGARRDDDELLRGALHAFFFDLLAASPNSASFVTADLLVIVSSSPLQAVVTGKTFYARNDRPSTNDITAQLRAYFSFWGSDQLNKYLGSDRVSILLNGVPVASHASEGESSDNAALSIIISVTLIIVAIAMFGFGIFIYRHFRQTNDVQEKQPANPPKESKPNPYPTNIEMALPGSLASVYKYEEADCESVAHYPHCRSRQYSVGDASKTSEEEFGPCSL